VAENTFERVLRGFNPDDVLARIDELESERDKLIRQLKESEESNTELRLSMAKQVEEASAEAAIVLGHGRSEAARIRETAIKESDNILETAKAKGKETEAEADATREEARSLRDEAKTEANEIRTSAQADAKSILESARSRAEELQGEASGMLEDAAKRSDQISSELRLQKSELDRQEGEIRDQADSYALRIHREADSYAQASEKRALDVERQAAEILAEAKRSAHDTAARATSTARKNLEESLRLVNVIFSDVTGSLSEVTRIRQVLGDQVERLSARESEAKQVTEVVSPPSVTAVETPMETPISDENGPGAEL
jgi:cell division septum initiation protein DivIVA